MNKQEIHRLFAPLARQIAELALLKVAVQSIVPKHSRLIAITKLLQKRTHNPRPRPRDQE